MRSARLGLGLSFGSFHKAFKRTLPTIRQISLPYNTADVIYRMLADTRILNMVA